MSEIINQVNLRKMEITDIIKVAEIEKASFPTPWSSYAFTCELLDNQFAHYIVMTLKDEPEKIIGYGGMWVIIDEAHVTNIAISPEYRGRRLGEILLLKMMEVAIDKGRFADDLGG